jgi:hypothetical protein
MLSRKMPYALAALESIAGLNLGLQRKTDVNMISVKFAAHIQNTNFTGSEARAGFRIVNCLTLLWKHRLNVGSFEDLPAPTVRFISMTVISAGSCFVCIM